MNKTSYENYAAIPIIFLPIVGLSENERKNHGTPVSIHWAIILFLVRIAIIFRLSMPKKLK